MTGPPDLYLAVISPGASAARADTPGADAVVLLGALSIAAIAAIGLLIKAASRSHNSALGRIAAGVGALVCMLVLVSTAPPAISGLLSVLTRKVSEAVGGATALTSPAAETAPPEPDLTTAGGGWHFPTGLVLGISITAAVLAVLVAGVMVGLPTWRRHRDLTRSAVDKTGYQRARWQAAQHTLHTVMVGYAEFESDPIERLQWPALSDVTHPPTAQFHEALADARALDSDTAAVDEIMVTAFVKAANWTRDAWIDAKESAERLGMDYYPVDIGRDVDKALKLLREAGSTTSEAAAAYVEKANEIIDRLTAAAAIPRLPTPARAALERVPRKAITGGPNQTAAGGGRREMNNEFEELPAAKTPAAGPGPGGETRTGATE